MALAAHLLKRAGHGGHGAFGLGAQIRDGVKSVGKQEACKEDPTWPYQINKFDDKPPEEAYKQGKRHQAIRYLRLTQALSQLKGCLADGLSVRLRVRGLRELREPGGRRYRQGADAEGT
jgi:hypothetical protein